MLLTSVFVISVIKFKVISSLFVCHLPIDSVVCVPSNYNNDECSCSAPYIAISASRVCLCLQPVRAPEISDNVSPAQRLILATYLARQIPHNGTSYVTCALHCLSNQFNYFSLDDHSYCLCLVVVTSTGIIDTSVQPKLLSSRGGCESVCAPPHFYYSATGTCYCIMDNKIPKKRENVFYKWHEAARLACKSRKATLATVKDDELKNELSKFLRANMEGMKVDVLVDCLINDGEVYNSTSGQKIKDHANLLGRCSNISHGYIVFSGDNHYRNLLCFEFSTGDEVIYTRQIPLKSICEKSLDQTVPLPTTTTTQHSETTTTKISGPFCSGQAFNTSWYASAGQVVSKPCPQGLQGQMTWTCGMEGRFTTQFPVTSDCTTGDNLNYGETIKGIYESLSSNPPSKPEECILWSDLLQTSNKQFLESVDLQGLSGDQYLRSYEEYFDAFVRCNEILLVDSVDAWDTMEQTLKVQTTLNLVKMTGQTGFAIADQLEIINQTYQYCTNTKRLVSEASVLAPSKDKVYVFHPKQFEKVRLDIPLNNFISNKFVKTVATIIESTDHGGNIIFPGSCKTKGSSNMVVNSNIVVLMVHNAEQDYPLQDPLTVNMEQESEGKYPTYSDITVPEQFGETGMDFVRGSSMPAAFDNKSMGWVKEDCYKWNKGDKTNKFKCFRSGSFAILTEMHNAVGNDPIEVALTTICLAASNIGFLFTFTALIISKKAGLQTLVIENVCVTMFCSNIIILFFMKKMFFSTSEDICKATGILLHFCLLSAFGWMGVSGYYINSIVSNVLSNFGSRRITPFVLAYGIPLVIVAGTVITSEVRGDQAYLHSEYCWLSADGYIWAFTCPSLLIIVTNIIWNLRALSAASNLAINKKRTMLQKTRTLAQGMLSLNAITGTSWIVGYLYLQKVPFLSYMFIILNGSQGVIVFLFHVLMNEKVRADVKIYFSKIMSTSSEMSYSKSTKTSSSQQKVPSVHNSKFLSSIRSSDQERQLTSHHDQSSANVDIPTAPPMWTESAPTPQ